LNHEFCPFVPKSGLTGGTKLGIASTGADIIYFPLKLAGPPQVACPCGESQKQLAPVDSWRGMVQKESQDGGGRPGFRGKGFIGYL